MRGGALGLRAESLHGADVFVAGSAVYDSDDPARAVQALRAQAERATAHAAWNRHGRPG